MWLPVLYSFSRNETVAAIKSGKYSNIRGMFSPSATTPTTGQWKTAQQAIQDGNETTPSYSLFQMGALCWYDRLRRGPLLSIPCDFLQEHPESTGVSHIPVSRNYS